MTANSKFIPVSSKKYAVIFGPIVCSKFALLCALKFSNFLDNIFRNQKVFGDFKRVVSHIDPDGDQVAVTKKYSSKKIPQPEDIQVEVPNVDFDEHSGMFFVLCNLVFHGLDGPWILDPTYK